MRDDVIGTRENVSECVAARPQAAERYRHLKHNPITFGNGCYAMWNAEALEATIEAAREEKK